ncbi:hypothetical protein INT43_003366 [Umbelopsis isabellina]|uniref:Ubiquitin carboxyl-terminal hydrolase n=1 Tax=Mortierella isabellina TaxID=91625 RepID=A0A8H7PQ46_MORIS|nr:hypothetical protein INT43_003366 [Umbelopsis isabellina]
MDSEDQAEAKKPELRWLPLESNPEVWNKLVHKLGVAEEWSYTDVFGLDPDLLAMVPQPVLAVLLLFPYTEKYAQFQAEEEARLTKLEQNISPNVYFIKQTISNACGMMALIHSIANNEKIVGPGVLQKFIHKTKHLSPDERAEFLEKYPEIADAHFEGASQGQTAAPNLEDDVDLHFICFVEADHHIYELDGRKMFPINHGKCTNLLEGSAKVIKQFMERDPDNLNFTVVALAPSSPV